MPELGSLCFLFLLPSFFLGPQKLHRLLFPLSWDNAHPFRDEIQASAAATAGTHKSSQKPPESLLLGVITGQRVISSGVSVSRARAGLPGRVRWPECVRAGGSAPAACSSNPAR